jgi:hypothetical protein
MRGGIIVLILAVACAGCGVTVREAKALQPNPIFKRRTTDDIPSSVPLHIFQGHYLLPGVRLGHWAQFVAVSRDRLRFHVGNVGYDEPDADTRDLQVWLEDESGHRTGLADREAPRLNRFWVRGHDVYEGVADYVFYEPELISSRCRVIALVVRHDGFEYRYTWTFGDGTEVHDYGYGEREIRNGVISVPGPFAYYEGTTYPDR